MTIRFITVLAIRILAIYVVIQALKNLPMFVGTSQMLGYLREPHMVGTNMESISYPFLIAGTVPFILLITLAFFLWAFAEKLVSFLYKKQKINSKEGEKSTDKTLKEIQIIAFSVVGLLILVNTLPQLFQLIPSWILMGEEYGFTSFTMRLQNTTYAIGLGIQVILGIYLFFGARGLAGILRKIREL